MISKVVTFCRCSLSELVSKIDSRKPPIPIPVPKKKMKWMVCGRNDWEQLALGHKSLVTTWTELIPAASFIQISSSSFYDRNCQSDGGFNFGLAQDGSLWSWGSNQYGQLGLGDDFPTSDPISTPHQIPFFAKSLDPVVQLHSGELHVGVVTSWFFFENCFFRFWKNFRVGK
jgi:alpha-tubulin suppressor-like RCC1 family protein